MTWPHCHGSRLTDAPELVVCPEGGSRQEHVEPENKTLLVAPCRSSETHLSWTRAPLVTGGQHSRPAARAELSTAGQVRGSPSAGMAPGEETGSHWSPSPRVTRLRHQGLSALLGSVRAWYCQVCGQRQRPCVPSAAALLPARALLGSALSAPCPGPTPQGHRPHRGGAPGGGRGWPASGHFHFFSFIHQLLIGVYCARRAAKG